MPYENLPGIFGSKQDGNTLGSTANGNPIVMIIGTASQGESETEYRVNSVGEAVRVYGKDGTLARGLYEVSDNGGKNMRLFRIGATAASLVGIGMGTGDGLTVETIRKDDSAGTDYTLFYEDATGRLRVWRASDDELVYDNNPAYPLEKTDLGEVAVYGTAQAGTESDLGTLAVPITLEDADLAHTGGTAPVFTDGTDGLNLSRMEMYEALHNAYGLLEDSFFDVVIPMNVYLDDLNVMDLTPTQIGATGRNLIAVTDYPDAGTVTDVLGKMYTEEYEGVNYFWWWFPTDPVASSMNTQFTSDSGANIFPSVGSASALLKADGTALTGDDFHEVNFAYQLANFCYVQSRDNTEITGTIGVLPPVSYAGKDVALWVGKLPTTTEDSNGNVVISTNGSGLLGNKFMSGRIGTAYLTAFTVNGVAGLFDGGFIATDTGFVDGTQLEDNNEHAIDIGKYISVVTAYPVLSNPSRPKQYSASAAPMYGGFYSDMSPASAPTNKLLGRIRLPFRINKTKLDQLAGQRYVCFHSKPRGIVVSDAPTAARPDSDYQRLSTVRQVKDCVDAIREAGEPFLGEGMTGSLMAALDTAIDSTLKVKVKGGVIARYDYRVLSTPQMRVNGQAIVELKLVPAFELRQITVVIALAAV
jgi:hypothetical protein